MQIATFWNPVTNWVPRELLGPQKLFGTPGTYLGLPGPIWDPIDYLGPRYLFGTTGTYFRPQKLLGPPRTDLGPP